MSLTLASRPEAPLAARDQNYSSEIDQVEKIWFWGSFATPGPVPGPTLAAAKFSDAPPPPAIADDGRLSDDAERTRSQRPMGGRSAPCPPSCARIDRSGIGIDHRFHGCLGSVGVPSARTGERGRIGERLFASRPSWQGLQRLLSAPSLKAA
jgi:hypothetical protein